MTEFIDAAEWFVIALGFCSAIGLVARMFKPSREKRCDTCVFSSCGRIYPKLTCSIIHRDVYPHNVCEKWK